MTEMPWSWRLMIRGSFTDRWRAATEEERAAVFDSWIIVHKAWQKAGCRLIVTIDDLTLVGTPNAGEWNFYAVWEIPTPDPKTMLPKLLTVIESTHLEYNQVHVRRATLEDVFLQLTGRSLRE